MMFIGLDMLNILTVCCVLIHGIPATPTVEYGCIMMEVVNFLLPLLSLFKYMYTHAHNTHALAICYHMIKTCLYFFSLFPSQHFSTT